MARYRGRHRAPSTTGRNLARTALVGAVAGAPLVMAVPAEAAGAGTWDRVAQCESGGRWNVNTGNGYHGGLQFSPRTWTGFGGSQFAPVAHQASRSEQIVVAERVLAKQGWGAWPVCSRKANARGEAATVRSAPAKTAKTAKEKSQQRHDTPEQATRVKLSAPAGGGYVVQRGDTLSRIAAEKGVAGGWKALVEKNPGLGAAPDRISPGQTISL